MLNKICIIAGESSGDLYAGRVIMELKKMNPDLKTFGIGGNKMKAEGVELLFHIEQMSFMGFLEVIKHLPFIKKSMDTMVNYTIKEKPDAIILVDYPGFNLKFAEKIRKHCKKIIYFITPQIWAWGRNRIKKIKDLIDELIVIFPFEKEFYRKENINVEFVGHPLLEIIEEHKYESKSDFLKKYDFKDGSKILAVFPGSRMQEINKHLPVIYEVLRNLLEREKINIAIAVSSTIPLEVYKKIIFDNRVKIIVNDQYNLLRYADLALVKSGTSTVETACFEVPMIIFYRSSWLTYFIGRMLVKLNYFGMVNIIAGRKVVPELLQGEVNPTNLLNHCTNLLHNEEEIKKIKEDLHMVKTQLGSPGASRKVAEIVFNLC